MEKIFELVGIEVPETWSQSSCSSHEKIKTVLEVEKGKVIATVRPDKLKLFGKDENGVFRCISWPLGSVDAEAEASLLLQKKFGVILPPAQQKVIAFSQPNQEDIHQRVMS